MIGPACPHCEVRLTPREKTGVGQFYCSSCLGFVAPVSALRKFLSLKEVVSFREAAVRSPKGQNPCTHCRSLMHVVWHAVGEHDVELDFCEKCSLVWFDTGEWKDVELADAKIPRKVNRTETLEWARAMIAEQNKMEVARKTTSIESVSSPSVLKAVLSFLGLPVEEDHDYFSSEPWVTWLLITACCILGVWLFGHEHIALSLAFYASDPAATRLLTSFTSFFVHGDIFHLLGNMYFLWIFGDNVEDELGKLRYIGLLVLATLMGNLLFGMFDPRAGMSPAIPAIGASGGIAGLVAFYLIRFPHRRFLMRFFFVYLIAIPAYLFGLMFFFKDVLGAVSQAEGLTEVSHLSHVGGALVGVVAAIVMRKKNRP